MTGYLRGQNFQDMCQIDQCEGTERFVAIRRVLHELFTKNHGGRFDPPPPLQVRGLIDRISTKCYKSRVLVLYKNRTARRFFDYLYVFDSPSPSEISFDFFSRLYLTRAPTGGGQMTAPPPGDLEN